MKNEGNSTQNKEQGLAKTTSKDIAISSNTNTGIDTIGSINTFSDVERLVDFIANSETYNSSFKRVSEDKDGNQAQVVDRAAIATCLMLGNELGFKPFESMMLGMRIGKAEAVVKIHRGRELGLPPMVALNNIYVFSGGGGEIVYTGIHVINRCLIKAGVKKEILEDGTKPFYIYEDVKTKDEVDIEDGGRYVILNNGISAKELEAEIKDGKVMVARKATTRALVKLTRGSETIAIPYTAKQAVEAGLLAGTNIYGEAVKGKTNWNNHPSTHLIKMSTILGARIIAADILNDMYIPDELPMDRGGNIIIDTDSEIID